ncbi:hypothetical protein ACFOYW_16025 [Gryllotalpicola reticulitermitis]|uniref:HTH cro/C1-type domain-containing protein n=1 Tax=Gryllotalpicola reticulitermitis TaxID=1184153 RepID=A0ABV8Q943_9MICO
MATAQTSRSTSALRAARDRHGFTRERAVQVFLETAQAWRIPMRPSVESLRGSFSRWENGRQQPGEMARQVLRIMYAATDAELGFDTEPEPSQPHTQEDELAARLVSATRVDPVLIEVLTGEVEGLRHQDRAFGGALLSERMAGLVGQLTRLMDYSLTPASATALASVLADAATLAGWQAVDTGASVRAWEHFTLAAHAARIAGSPTLLAHALGERAYAVLEAGDAVAARQTISHALTLAPLPGRVTAWLHAAEGELSAAAGDRDGALSAFDAAARHLPSSGVSDEDSPFIMLNEAHLTRWRGSALALLADPESVTDLTAALGRFETGASSVRATAGLHADLAAAYVIARDRDRALHHLRQADGLATQIGSLRLAKRLERLRRRIPGQ